METITPCRRIVSERFPVISFMVRVPAGRHYEIVCATDPNLYHPDYARYRSPQNFYTSRNHGLMQSNGDTHTFLMPQDQAERFSGNKSLYYAIGSYGDKKGDDPRFSISPHALNQVPRIRLTEKLRASNRYRRSRPPAYGSPHHAGYTEKREQLLRWGGDDSLTRLRDEIARQPLQQPSGALEYDDGFSNELWQADGISYAESSSSASSWSNGYSSNHHTGDSLGSVTSHNGTYSDIAAARPHHFSSGPASGLDQRSPYNPMSSHDPTVSPATIGGKADYNASMPELALPVGPASAPLSDAPATNQPLDIPEKVRLLRLVSEGMPGTQGYATTFADEQAGLRWGLAGFRQRSGELGEVLRKARDRELRLEQEQTLEPQQRLSTLFGEEWEQLLAQTDPARTVDPNARMQPLGGAPLWQEPWLSRFSAAAAVPYIQYAQNEVAVERVADPAERVAFWLGLNAPFGPAMIMDRIVEMGIGGGVAWLMDMIGPIRTEADISSALQAVTGSAQLAAFQASQGLEATGVWDPLSHAALTGALRGMGANSPIVVLTPQQMLDAVLAQKTPFAERLAALKRRFEQTAPTDYLSESR